jgi:beta-ureidopropionase
MERPPARPASDCRRSGAAGVLDSCRRAGRAVTGKAIRSVREPAAQGAQVVCLQELFNGPYFCQVQDKKWYEFAESVPDGPTVREIMDLACLTPTCSSYPVYEGRAAGVFYDTAAVIDADGKFLGKHRKNHAPRLHGFWEKFYFRPANLGYPVFDTAVGSIGVHVCCERHFPEGSDFGRRSRCVQSVGDESRLLGVF